MAHTLTELRDLATEGVAHANMDKYHLIFAPGDTNFINAWRTVALCATGDRSGYNVEYLATLVNRHRDGTLYEGPELSAARAEASAANTARLQAYADAEEVEERLEKLRAAAQVLVDAEAVEAGTSMDVDAAFRAFEVEGGVEPSDIFGLIQVRNEAWDRYMLTGRERQTATAAALAALRSLAGEAEEPRDDA